MRDQDSAVSTPRTSSDNPRAGPRWLAIVGILLGLLYVGGGIGYLTWSSRRAPGAQIPQAPASTQAAAAATTPVRQATLDAAATRLTSLRATAAAQPTATPSPTPQPTPTLAAGLTEIAILHSNDTWGYTLPCG
ncbi:MAG: hypothetical protein JXA09_00620 [Anaerolineae bacterium]|nr:hypothetical protein [Anaerolineae bacterium]